MSKFAHTPGPWTVDICKQQKIQIRAGTNSIAEVYGYGMGRRLDDAVLMASAPDLLVERDALRALLREARDRLIEEGVLYSEPLNARINAVLNKGGDRD